MRSMNYFLLLPPTNTIRDLREFECNIITCIMFVRIVSLSFLKYMNKRTVEI